MNKKLSLGTLCKTFSGGTPSVKEKSYYINGTIPFIRSGEIHGNKTQLFLTEKGVKHSSAKYITKGDLLIALYGANSGDVAISQIDGVINQAILCIRSSKLNITYLKNLLLLEKDKILRKYLQGGQGNLSAEIIKSLKYNFPPIEEQKRIAKVLSTWDEGIENLEKLIALKEKQKRALMQRLLTGKTRLKGFSTPWKKVKLGDIGVFSKGKGISKDIITTQGVPCVRYGEIYTAFNFILDSPLSFIPMGQKQGLVLAKKNDILFASSGETKEEIGKSITFQGDYNLFVGGDIIIFSPNNKINSIFLIYYLNVVSRRKLNQLGQGDSVVHIYRNHLENLKIEFPSSKEQQAIAEVLTTADHEISQLKNKLEVFKKQKKYLMQQLLTGKKRLV